MKVSNVYDPKITKAKGAKGAVQGGVAGIIALAVGLTVKTFFPEAEVIWPGITGAVTSAISIGAFRLWRNWKKNKDKDK